MNFSLKKLIFNLKKFYFFRNKKVVKKIKNIENTLVQFDGKIVHAGCNPEKVEKKLCLNINYI